MTTVTPATAALTNADTSNRGVFGQFKNRFLGNSQKVSTTSPQRTPRSSSSRLSTSQTSKTPSNDTSSKSSIGTASRTSIKTTRSQTSNQAGPSSARPKPASGRASTYSATSRGSNNSKNGRAPSPPSMYASFGFEGPIKKPRPLPLDPKKIRPKHTDGKQKQKHLLVSTPMPAAGPRHREISRNDDQSQGSSPTSPVTSSLYPSTISSSPRNSLADNVSTFSSISSFKAGSPTDTVDLQRCLDSTIKFNAAGAQAELSPAEFQYLDVPFRTDVSDDSGAETPSAKVLEFQSNRNAKKLARVLGESVTDLAFSHGEENTREGRWSSENARGTLPSGWITASVANNSLRTSNDAPKSKVSPKSSAETTGKRQRPMVAPRPEFVYSITHAGDVTGREEGRWVTVEASVRSSQESQNRPAMTPLSTSRLNNARAGITVQIPNKEPLPPRSSRRPATAAGSLPSPVNSSFSVNQGGRQGHNYVASPNSIGSAGAALADELVRVFDRPNWIERTLRDPPSRSTSLAKRPSTTTAAAIDISPESGRQDRTAWHQRTLVASGTAIIPETAIADREIERVRPSQNSSNLPATGESEPGLRVFAREPAHDSPLSRSRAKIARRSSTSSGLSPSREKTPVLSPVSINNPRDLTLDLLAVKRSGSLQRPQTSDGSLLPPSPGPFAIRFTDGAYLAPPSPADGVRRKERKEGWSGEWNQLDMQDVIRKIRELK